MPTDKTGAEVTVSAAEGKYTIAVDGETVGLAAVADRGNQRIFYHTEVEERFGGRGLATILVAEALEATRADGKSCCPGLPDGGRLHQKASRVQRHHRQGHPGDPALGGNALARALISFPGRPIRRRTGR